MQEVAVLRQKLSELNADLFETQSGRDRAATSFAAASRQVQELEPQLSELRSSYQDARQKATARREEIVRLQADRAADQQELANLNAK